MNYRILTLILPALLWLQAQSQNRSIRFVEKPWSEILSQAKAEKKSIFLDAYTSWCGPCKWMAANMFTKDTIADYYNKSFLCAHFDMEKGEGVSLAQIYQVGAYPTLLFINYDGDVLHKVVGAPQKISDYFEMARIALTPGEGLNDYIRRFKEGQRDPAFLTTYLARLQGAYMPVQEPLQIYLSTQKESDLENRTNWEIIIRYVNDIDSREFLYLLSHRKQYEKLYTADSVGLKIFSTYLQTFKAATQGQSFDENAYNAVKDKVRKQGTPEGGKAIFYFDLNLLHMKGETDKFLALADSGVDLYFINDPMLLANMTRIFMSMTTNKKYLEKAASWGKKAVELNNTPENNDMYANLLFMLGRKSEAIKYEKIAIELSNKTDSPNSNYEQNLKKFELP
jgi:thiol-disulfide isomerase/thioredoxin